MLHPLLDLPIVSPAVLVPVDVVAVVLVLLTLLGPVTRGRTGGWRRQAWTRRVVRAGAGIVAGVVGLVVVWWVDDVRNVFGVAFTPVTRMWLAFLAAAIGIAVVVLVEGGWWRRMLAVAMVLAVALASGLGVNVDFGAYRTLGDALVPDPYPTGLLAHQHPTASASASPSTVVDAATWEAPSDMPSSGTITSVTIPATVSHFTARKALVWLPPAARVADPPTLPVIVALSGQPGQPSDLFEAGNLGHDLDAYAAAHHGLAPIVVAPDQLGASSANPMCVDSKALGNSATYIMTDTVHWIRTHLHVAAAPSAWSVLGFSEGATCAMQFSAAHPDVFGSALAISSELAPFNTSAAYTIRTAFGGSAAAWAAASPLGLMRAHAPYQDHLTVFGWGSADGAYAQHDRELATAAHEAGMQTETVVSPGTAHDWNTVRYVLEHGLPAVIAHTGLPSGSASADVGPQKSVPWAHRHPSGRTAVRPRPSDTGTPAAAADGAAR